jgi:hypothetical protein
MLTGRSMHGTRFRSQIQATSVIRLARGVFFPTRMRNASVLPKKEIIDVLHERCERLDPGAYGCLQYFPAAPFPLARHEF